MTQVLQDGTTANISFKLDKLSTKVIQDGIAILMYENGRLYPDKDLSFNKVKNARKFVIVDKTRREKNIDKCVLVKENQEWSMTLDEIDGFGLARARSLRRKCCPGPWA